MAAAGEETDGIGDLAALTIVASGATDDPAMPQAGEPVEALSLQPVVRQGRLLKRCRRNGDGRPWKLRYFVLRGSTLLYGHPDVSPKKDEDVRLDALRLLVHLSEGATVTSVDAPKGFGVSINVGRCAVAIAAHTEADRQEWQQVLGQAVGLPRCALADLGDTDGRHLPGRSLRLRQAVAGAVASSGIGKKIIKRYMVEPARTLIATLIAFAGALDGSKHAGMLEKCIFDVTARIAVVVNSNSLPADLDRQTLVETTMDFCQDFLHHSRDRRLSKQRFAITHAPPEPIEMDKLLTSAGYITRTWRRLVEPRCTPGALERFDTVVAYFFSDARLRLVLDDMSHRPHLEVIDRCLRELMEYY